MVQILLLVFGANEANDVIKNITTQLAGNYNLRERKNQSGCEISPVGGYQKT
jgi:hypothetical protein